MARNIGWRPNGSCGGFESRGQGNRNSEFDAGQGFQPAGSGGFPIARGGSRGWKACLPNASAALGDILCGSIPHLPAGSSSDLPPEP